MSTNQPTKRVVVAIDGSEHAAQALEWALEFAKPLEAEIIAVFAIPPPSYLEFGAGYGVPVIPPELDPEWRAEIQREFEQDWCKPLRDSGLPYRTVIEDGRAASVIASVADREEADLVVVGRRGRGSVSELVLGSVSHELAQHCKHPLVVISQFTPKARKEPAIAAAVRN
jgi:nucleotide-binding universal stress UspA family protein